MIGIERAHLEEDAAKTIHVGGAEGRIHGAEHSLVDFNRSGTPLVEIVTKPDIRSPEEAKAFLQLLRQTVVELGISDAEMEKGSLRFDVNVSVRPEGSDELRTRTELKNMNSFNFAAKGIEREVRAADRDLRVRRPGRPGDAPLRPGQRVRAAAALEGGGAGLPLLPGARPRAARAGRGARRAPARGAAGAAVGADPAARGARSASRSPRGSSRAGGTSSTRGSRATGPPVANVVMNELAALGLEPSAVNAEELGKVIAARGEIPRSAFDEALAESASTGFSAERYLAETAIADVGELDPVIDRILSANESQVAAVPRRQGGPARLLRRPGDEGDRRQGEPEGGQRAPAREAACLSRRG